MDTEQRLSKLERENWRLKLGGVVLAVSLAAATAFSFFQSPVAEAQTSSQTITAREFLLVNDEGELIGRLGESSDGQPQLYIWEAPSPENGGVRSSYITLHIVPHESGGGALMALRSASDGGGILLRTYEDRRMPFIQVYDPRGQATWSAP